MKPLRTIAKLKSGAETTVVALGDSLTQGWMVRRGFLDFLAEMLRKAYPESRFRIVNRGIPGDTAEGGLHRLRADVLDHNPDCVLIQFALNDAFCGYGVEQFGQYVQWMVDEIREDGDAEIVLVTSSYVGNNRETRFVENFYRELENLAAVNGLPLARVHSYWKKRIGEDVEFRTLVQADLVHPTTAGYKLMAEAVMQLF